MVVGLLRPTVTLSLPEDASVDTAPDIYESFC